MQTLNFCDTVYWPCMVTCDMDDAPLWVRQATFSEFHSAQWQRLSKSLLHDHHHHHRAENTCGAYLRLQAFFPYSAISDFAILQQRREINIWLMPQSENCLILDCKLVGETGNGLHNFSIFPTAAAAALVVTVSCVPKRRLHQLIRLC